MASFHGVLLMACLASTSCTDGSVEGCSKEECRNLERFANCQFGGNDVGGAQHRVAFGQCSGTARALRWRLSAQGISTSTVRSKTVAERMQGSGAVVKMARAAILNTTADNQEVCIISTSTVEKESGTEVAFYARLMKVGGLHFGMHHLEESCSACIDLNGTLKLPGVNLSSLRIHLSVSEKVEGTVEGMLRNGRFSTQDLIWFLQAYLSDGKRLGEAGTGHPDPHFGNLFCRRSENGWHIVWADPGASRLNSSHWLDVSFHSLYSAVVTGQTLSINEHANASDLLSTWGKSLIYQRNLASPNITHANWYGGLYTSFQDAFNAPSINLPLDLRKQVCMRLNPVAAQCQGELAELKTEHQQLRQEHQQLRTEFVAERQEHQQLRTEFDVLKQHMLRFLPPQPQPTPTEHEVPKTEESAEVRKDL